MDYLFQEVKDVKVFHNVWKAVALKCDGWDHYPPHLLRWSKHCFIPVNQKDESEQEVFEYVQDFQ